MKNKDQKIHYAVVGLGHIAQVAVLPAFENAKSNSVLTALVSSDLQKLKQLGKKYDVTNLCTYDEYEDLVASGEVDAVYICTPNDMHREFAEIAADYKVHILCEKPLAENEAKAFSMLRAARINNVKLMTAYRLHFDPANLKAIEIASSGKLGDLKLFNSVFSMQVKDRKNIRLDLERAGGPLHDIGIYCINAARYIFRDEPIEVFALAANSGEKRFREVEESMAVTLRFPKERLATFSISFGASDASSYDVVGSKARLRLENAYDYALEMILTVTKDEKTTTKRFAKHDQFAPELIYFSDCILKNKEPEPSAVEGLADLRVIDALFESLRRGRPVRFANVIKKSKRPDMKQAIRRPAHGEPRLFHAHSASESRS